MAALERMRNSERNLKRTQEAARLGSFSLRIETNVSRLSTEMASLIGMEDAIVHPNLATFMSMIEDDCKERFSECIELAKIGQTITDLEISVRLKSGEVEFFQCTIEPERNSLGEVETLFGSCQCVTERKALERKFLQAQKMEAVGQLAGGVAHDFNNILTAIIGYGSLLHMKMREDEPLRVYAEHILASAQKATHLTQSLLAFSRKQILNPEPANVNEILLNVRRLLSRTIGEDIELVTSVGEGELTILADVVQIEQVLMNLAINARDAMPDGGILTIGIEPVNMDPAYVRRNNFGRPGHFVRISVIDTGIGMDETTKERIFEPFFTTKEVGKGTGLGLSMVYGFVKQSGGHIQIHSEVGHGTTVELYLPRARTMDTKAAKHR